MDKYTIIIQSEKSFPMSAPATEKQLAQFRIDYALLRTRHRNKEMAKVLGIHETNLSACGRGTKNPGAEFLEKFYAVYGKEIEALSYKHPGNEFGRYRVDEPETPVKYLHSREDQHIYAREDREDHIETLKKNNDALLTGIREIIANNNKVIDNNTIAVRSTEKALETTADAIKGTNKVIDLIVSRFG